MLNSYVLRPHILHALHCYYRIQMHLFKKSHDHDDGNSEFRTHFIQTFTVKRQNSDGQLWWTLMSLTYESPSQEEAIESFPPKLVNHP